MIKLFPNAGSVNSGKCLGRRNEPDCDTITAMIPDGEPGT